MTILITYLLGLCHMRITILSMSDGYLPMLVG